MASFSSVNLPKMACYFPPVDVLILAMIFAQVTWVTPAELYRPKAILPSAHKRGGKNEEWPLSIGYAFIFNLPSLFLCPSLTFLQLGCLWNGCFHKISRWSNSGASFVAPAGPEGAPLLFPVLGEAGQTSGLLLTGELDFQSVVDSTLDLVFRKA